MTSTRGILSVLVAAMLVGSLPGFVQAAEPNQPPVAVDDPGESCWFGEGGYIVPEDPAEPWLLAFTCAPLSNDVDPDGDVLTAELLEDAAHGHVEMAGSTDDVHVAAYMPDDDFSTPPELGAWGGVSDSFTYRATDGQAWSNAATYRLWVAPINDPPSFEPGAEVVVVEQDSGAYAEAWATDIDPGPNEGDQEVEFEVVRVELDGVSALFSGAPTLDSDGTLTFTPGVHQCGLAHVTVRAVDDGGLEDWSVADMLREQPDNTSDEVTFSVAVRCNEPPVALDDTAIVAQGSGPALIPVLANDSDPDGGALTVTSVTAAAHGTVSIASGGTGLVYEPTGLYSGLDAFSYTVDDGRAGADTATVVVTLVADTVGPTISELRQTMPAQAVSGSTVRVRLSWGATDEGTGVSTYQLEQRIEGGAWTKVTSHDPRSRATTVDLSLKRKHDFRVRAVDRAGNVGAWAAFPTLFATRIQDGSSRMTYVRSWRKAVGGRLSGGSARYADSATRRATLTFTGRGIGWISTIRPTGGRAQVRLDGALVATIDLDGPNTRYRRLVFQQAFASSGEHRIEIRPVGDGRVDVDAVVVLR